MRAIILFVFLSLAAATTYAQSKELNINATTLNEVVVGKWILTNVDPAGAAPFQEFQVKGPGFGDVSKLRDDKKIEKIISKIVLSNNSVTFSDADGDRYTFKVLELTKNTIKLSDGKVTCFYSKI